MRKWIGVVWCVALVLSIASPALAENPNVAKVKERLAEEVSTSTATTAQVKTFIQETLFPLCTNPVFVQGIKAQNAKGLSLDQIKKIDQEWMDAEDELPIQATLTSNPCAEEIKKIAKENPTIGETFITDNQGANVGQNDLTSDYWQGDEGKWQNSFNNGQGGVDIGKNKFDKSANSVIQQISLPVIDEEGNVIGAITVGALVDRL